mmetsp:Transcript_25687/g.48181  ORF Transcript_25687/g.48181 Transcript_25687/m.48181 type:complete len:431 (+) Transcript_25687:179-1471(+)
MTATKKLKSGWLTKKGHFIKNWKKRFVVLTRESLCYYATSVMSDKRGEFLFDDNQMNEICVTNYPDTTSKPYRFALENKATGAYLELCALTSVEKKDWIEVIENLLRGVVSSDGHRIRPRSKSNPSLTKIATPPTSTPSSPNTSSNSRKSSTVIVSNENIQADEMVKLSGEVMMQDEMRELQRLNAARNYFLASDSEDEDITTQYQKRPEGDKSVSQGGEGSGGRVVDSDDEVESDIEYRGEQQVKSTLHATVATTENNNEDKASSQPSADSITTATYVASSTGLNVPNTVSSGETGVVLDDGSDSEDEAHHQTEHQCHNTTVIDSKPISNIALDQSSCNDEKESGSEDDWDDDDVDVDRSSGVTSDRHSAAPLPPPPPPPSTVLRDSESALNCTSTASVSSVSSALQNHEIDLPDLDELLVTPSSGSSK